MEKFSFTDKFMNRHLGPTENDIDEMLKIIGINSLNELIDKTVPQDIRLDKPLNLKSPITEFELLEELKQIASKNKIFKSFIGMGYSTTIVPNVIKRNVFENPSWYTQYTPYQAEISQGRLEALLNFQTMISDLTAMPLANASLLDEGTAAAEAMNMLHSLRKSDKKDSHVLLVSSNIFPQTIDVVKTRALPLGIDVKVVNGNEFLMDNNVFAIMVQYPGDDGKVEDFNPLFKEADNKGVFKIVAADLLSLTLLQPPGEFGADVVVGSTQRFGVPMGFGGPHAAYFATKDEFKRFIPGRIIGVSVDSKGRRALRMALQTREQHIKRERATSNICTAQVLLAIMASMYAVYHGPEGLKNIAKRIHSLSVYLAQKFADYGFVLINNDFFDTVTIQFNKEEVDIIRHKAEENEINLRYFKDNKIGISIGETATINDINLIFSIISSSVRKKDKSKINFEYGLPKNLERKSQFLTHTVFNSYHSETEMMRYIKRLEKKDLSLTQSMISLGSCTMKLNAATELYPVSWPEFSDIHPFAPKDQVTGYMELISSLKQQIKEITGFDDVSLQPNSGAQGEYTGLLVIRAYHQDRGDINRNIVLIPSSAHGTNPASATLAGNKVIIVKCDENGNIDINDLRSKAEQNKENLNALMVTYPSTHGVFEEGIVEIVNIIHEYGGLVYMDGANLNAQLGLTNPAKIGADVCHLNLHKTFAIPHGGGGPGVGPIAVNKKLVKYLPGHAVIDINNSDYTSAVSSAPYGSAGIFVISYSYIRMMGGEGLKRASEIAILNANYIKAKLQQMFKTLYKGNNGFVAHELILDLRAFKHTVNIDVEDIAKRLMDYGYHAPTVSFPVHDTFMIEPTESESKFELDKFCDTMEMIYNEILEVESGKADKIDNVLKNAPHTFDDVTQNWDHKYSIQKAVAPADWLKEDKFWPTVSRIDNAYGDRNLVCTCLPIEEYNN